MKIYRKYVKSVYLYNQKNRVDIRKMAEQQKTMIEC